MRGGLPVGQTARDGKAARVQPDRRWFGNTRFIGQKELTEFREKMAATQADPYAVLLKRSKLPMGLLTNGNRKRGRVDLLRSESYEHVFGKKGQRKRPKLHGVMLAAHGATAVEAAAAAAAAPSSTADVRRMASRASGRSCSRTCIRPPRPTPRPATPTSSARSRRWVSCAAHAAQQAGAAASGVARCAEAKVRSVSSLRCVRCPLRYLSTYREQRMPCRIRKSDPVSRGSRLGSSGQVFSGFSAFRVRRRLGSAVLTLNVRPTTQ